MSSSGTGSTRPRARSSAAGRGSGVLELDRRRGRAVRGIQIPFAGLVVLGAGLLAAGVVTLVVAQVDAGPDGRRGGDQGDARGLSADPPEDDGAGPVDEPGRRRGEDRLARDARPGPRLVGGARAAGRCRARPRAQPRGPPGRPGRRPPRTCRCGTGTARASSAAAQPEVAGPSSRLRPCRTSAGCSASSGRSATHRRRRRGGGGGFGGGGSGGGGGGAGGGF